jgi:hypothetical protein
LWPAAFAGWTLFVWGGRLRNLWLEPGPLSDVSRWSLAGALTFSILGLALVAALISGFGARVAVAALGLLSVGVWAVRGIDIALGDHSVGFIAVHLVLAVVSAALAWMAWRSVGGRFGARDRSALRYAGVDG